MEKKKFQDKLDWTFAFCKNTVVSLNVYYNESFSCLKNRILPTWPGMKMALEMM